MRKTRLMVSAVLVAVLALVVQKKVAFQTHLIFSDVRSQQCRRLVREDTVIKKRFVCGNPMGAA